VAEYYTMASSRIFRTTMFKVPDLDHQNQLIAAYHKMAENQCREDGQPYIVGLRIGQALDDPRAKGYTIVVDTVFANIADMLYYDNKCPAHAELREVVRAGNWAIATPPLTVYYQGGQAIIVK